MGDFKNGRDVTIHFTKTDKTEGERFCENIVDIQEVSMEGEGFRVIALRKNELNETIDNVENFSVEWH